MKKGAAFSGFALGLLVLLSILVQSLHHFEHLSDFYSEKHCDHHYAVDKSEFSHSHNDAEDCTTCEFTFSASYFGIASPLLHTAIIALPEYSFGPVPTNINFYSGSSLQYRGPPSFIV